MKQAEIQKELQERIEEEKRKELLDKKAYDKRFKIMMEERRMKEMHQAMLDEIEEQNMRKKAQELHDRDRKLQEERDRKLLELKLQLKAETEQKQLEHEEHKRKLQQYFADEQMKTREKLETIEAAEQRKREALQERNQRLLEDNQRKREVARRRIERNRQLANYLEQKRKDEIYQKQSEYDEKRSITLAQQEEERQLHAVCNLTRTYYTSVYMYIYPYVYTYLDVYMFTSMYILILSYTHMNSLTYIL